MANHPAPWTAAGGARAVRVSVAAERRIDKWRSLPNGVEGLVVTEDCFEAGEARELGGSRRGGPLDGALRCHAGVMSKLSQGPIVAARARSSP